jgi:hypothetical protein
MLVVVVSEIWIMAILLHLYIPLQVGIQIIIQLINEKNNNSIMELHNNNNNKEISNKVVLEEVGAAVEILQTP